jgi:hypothetical protein
MFASGVSFPVWVNTVALPINATKATTEVTPIVNEAIPLPLWVRVIG